MKNLLGTFVLFIISLSFTFGQSPSLKNGIFANRVFTDAQSTNGGDFFNFKAYRPAWELGYTRNVYKNLNVVIPIRAGVYSNSSESVQNIPYFSMDVQGQYYFYEEGRTIIPFIAAGLGFSKDFDAGSNVQVPLGAGLFVRMFEGAYFSVQSSYRVGFSEGKSSWQHAVGFVYSLNKKATVDEIPEDMAKVEDADGDGVPNDLDLCPSIYGLEEFNGCPDSDGDGIEDSKDKCPEFAGLVAFGGCPDSDNDGVPDNDDDCPNLKGDVSNHGCPIDESKRDDDGDGVPNINDKCPNISGSVAAMGCPDRDGDGVSDANDKCPNIKGSAMYSGCPGPSDSDNDGIEDDKDECPTEAGLLQFNGCPDTDGDGVPDSKDQCPNSFGLLKNKGCPEIKKEDREVLDIAMRAVQFNTGKSTLKSSSFLYLDQIAMILKDYPDYKLIIGGHTDDVGSAVINQRLSERRAKSCYEYLINKGIDSRRLRYAGYGESRPIAENLTARGRSLNRRVEFKLVPTQR